jgi:hypothetical protein
MTLEGNGSDESEHALPVLFWKGGEKQRNMRENVL